MTWKNKELTLVLPLLCLLVLLPFWQLATGQGIVITNDIGVSDIANLQYPLRYFAGQQLRQGRLPLWTPGVYMGFPFLAEGQAGVFSPVNLLLFGLLPVPAALNLGSLLPFVIAALGAYVLARELGAGVAGAFLAGFSYAMSGFYVAHIKHIPIVTTATWIPILLYLVERGVKRSDSALLAVGLVMGIQWLSGSPQMAYYAAGIAALYFFARAWQERRERPLRRITLLFGLALILSLGLAAVQLLPTYQLVGFSERAGGVSYDFAVSFPYAVDNLKTFLYPLANGTPGTGDLRVSSIFWEDYAYLGLIPLFLGIAGGLALARRSGLARLLVGLTGMTFLLVLGPHTPIFRPAYQWVPGLGFFRFPQRLLAFVVLFLVLLAALALTRLQTWLEERIDGSQRTKDQWRRPSQVFGAVVLVLVILDLYFYHFPWNAIVDADVWLEPPETAKVMEERAGSALFRVYSHSVYNTFRSAYRRAGGWRGDLGPYIDQREFLQPSLNLIYDVPAADGYINLVPECLAALWGTEKQFGQMDTGLVTAEDQLVARRGFVKSLGLYNVRFLITSSPVHEKGLDLVGVYGPNAHLYENNETMPRAYAVPNHTVISNTLATLDLIRTASFDPETTVVLSETPNNPPLSPPRDTGGTAEGRGEPFAATVDVMAYEPNHIVVQAKLNRPGWLVLSDTYYPGWEATVDERSAPIYQANGCVRAVPLEAGAHEVVFRFRPRPFYTGALITGVSGVLWVAIWLTIKLRERQ